MRATRTRNGSVRIGWVGSVDSCQLPLVVGCWLMLIDAAADDDDDDCIYAICTSAHLLNPSPLAALLAPMHACVCCPHAAK
jgi:hypothetical protein